MMLTFFRISEILLGIIFLGAGFNGYLVLFGADPIMPTSPQAEELLGTGYLLALEKTIEVLCGILLIVRRYVPLALLILMPLVVNILAFHLFVDAELLPLALIIVLLSAILLWGYRRIFVSLLERKAVPTSSGKNSTF